MLRRSPPVRRYASREVSMFGVFLLLAIVGELAALVYFAYALPALHRAQPLGKRRYAGFIASTIAIPPVALSPTAIQPFACRHGCPGRRSPEITWTSGSPRNSVFERYS